MQCDKCLCYVSMGISSVCTFTVSQKKAVIRQTWYLAVKWGNSYGISEDRELD